MPLRIRRRGADLLLVMAALCVLFVVSGIVTWTNARALERATQDAARAASVLLGLEGLLSLARDAETGQRGYVLTGRAEYLAPYEAARTRLGEQLEQLDRLAPYSAPLRERLPGLQARLAERLALAERAIELRRDAGLEAARSVVLSGQGKAVMDTLRVEVAELQQLERERRIDRLAALRRANRVALAAGLLTAALGVGATLVGWRLALRNARARRMLHDERERLRRVLDSMFAFVGVLAPDGTLLEANRAPLQAAGVARRDVVGRRFWDCPWWDHDPAVRERLVQAFARACAGEVVRYDETIRTRGDGRMVIDFMLQPVFDGEALQLLIASATDITERKHLERELTEADRRKDEFLAMLAHELRNPLAPVRTGLQVLRRTSAPSAGAARVLDMMQRQLAHMVRLVDDLLDLSRVARNRIELRCRPLALQAVLQGAVEASQPFFEQHGQALRVALPDEPLVIEGDETRLVQVVTNLLHNAAKFTPPGGRIELAAWPEDGTAVIRVTDTGVGIAPGFLPHVFDHFTQSERDLSRSEGGLGIGLSLVRHLAILHGGSVEAASDGLGRGSAFTVRLPLAQAPAAIARPQTA